MYENNIESKLWLANYVSKEIFSQTKVPIIPKRFLYSHGQGMLGFVAQQQKYFCINESFHLWIESNLGSKFRRDIDFLDISTYETDTWCKFKICRQKSHKVGVHLIKINSVVSFQNAGCGVSMCQNNRVHRFVWYILSNRNLPTKQFFIQPWFSCHKKT